MTLWDFLYQANGWQWLMILFVLLIIDNMFANLVKAWKQRKKAHEEKEGK